jgi:hypothetical protein
MIHPRRMVAIIAIAILIAIVYIFSITPYLLNPGRASSSPAIEIAVPAVSVALILAIVFIVPSRKIEEEYPESLLLRNKDQEDEYKLKEEKRKDHDIAEHRFRKKSLISGAIGGFISALVLVGLILIGDAALGFNSGTLYSIIGSTMAGLSMPYSLYFGISMHLATGTLVGLVFGYVTAVLGVFDITSLSKGMVLGILAGFASFSLLFIPITRFGVQNSLTGFLTSISPPGTDPILIQNRAIDIMSTVLAGAIVFHVVYGAIMGFITSHLLLRRRIPEGKGEEEETKKKVLGTR